MRTYPEHLPFWIEKDDLPQFPPTEFALDEPNGLLAVSAPPITVEWLRCAYPQGCFPWSSEGEQISWWSPAPRCVLFTDQIKVSKSLAKVIRNANFDVTLNQAFERVLWECAHIHRPGQNGTWLRKDLQQALIQLHKEGNAHSVEVWQKGDLVGGLYGLSFGQMFFGESMFAKVSNSSKIALVALCCHLQAYGWSLIDCQMETDLL